jgi:hypothetical protein
MLPIKSRYACSRLILFAGLSLAVVPISLAGEQPPNPFDGKSLDAWMTADGKPVTRGWEVVDGVIHLKKESPRAGNILTRHEYGDFELSFEWKIAQRGNSGLKYRVRNYGNKTLGLEYQVYDDNTVKRVPPKGSAGSLYDLYEPNEAKQLKPVGEFNHARIVVRQGHIEHWLNGKLIVSAKVGDEEWQRRVAASKFSEYPHFAQNETGRLMLTDHGSEAWYRNFEFKPLTAQP